MKNKLTSADERILMAWEKYMESPERELQLFCTVNNTTIRNLSLILKLIHKKTITEFLTEYSQTKCINPNCGHTTKYKITGYKYDKFCSPECRTVYGGHTQYAGKKKLNAVDKFDLGNNRKLIATIKKSLFSKMSIVDYKYYLDIIAIIITTDKLSKTNVDKILSMYLPIRYKVPKTL